MTLTIYINANNLNWDIIHKADEIGGMIEQVEENLISWHDLSLKEISFALQFVSETWGHITVDITKENRLSLCYCESEFLEKITF